MRKIWISPGCWFLMVMLTGLCAGHACCQGFLRAGGERIVNEQGQEVLLRGIGLGGWMLQEPYMLQLSGVAVNQSQIRARIIDLVGPERTANFYASWRAHFIRKPDIDSLASWGFNCVRVPLHYNLFTLPVGQEPVPGQQTWIDTGFALTDSLLAWCKADHIYLILDLHAAPGGQGNDIAISDKDKSMPSLWQDTANQQKMVALWKKLAERYAGASWIGGYDLLNETNWGFTNSSDEHGCKEKGNGPLLQLLKATTAAIRSVDTRHLIFIEGNCWANNFQGLLPAWDSNMAVSFHKYWNNNDEASIQGVLDLRARYHIPLWLGESGENSNTWTTDAIALVERNHISWTWWPLKKAGGNNPLEFHLDSGFRHVVAYWAGKADRPSADDAYGALMQLASAVSAAQNTYHKDVIDAMFRQVRTDNTLPFVDDAIRAGSRLFAVNYDLGRNGFAYYDKDTGNYKTSTGHYSEGNKGGCYRNDGVDISRCADSATNGYAVTAIEAGEWLQYTVTIARSGYYNIHYRVEAASEKEGASAAAENGGSASTSAGNGQRAAGNGGTPVPASWQLLDCGVTPAAAISGASNATTSATHGAPIVLDSCTLPSPVDDVTSWHTTGHEKIYLSAGIHRLRLLAKNAGFNINYISFD